MIFMKDFSLYEKLQGNRVADIHKLHVQVVGSQTAVQEKNEKLFIVILKISFLINIRI